MKIGITYRLFLSILAATSVAVLSMFLIMQWSINRGFYRYLRTLDQGRLDQMAERLQRVYAEQGSWDFLDDEPEHWIVRFLNATPEAGPGSPAAGATGDTGAARSPLAPPADAGRAGLRLIILDEDENPLFGSYTPGEEASLRPILYHGEVVGYLGLLPPRHFLDRQQLGFLREQRQALALAAAGMALVVMIFSLPLANRLVRPIRAMAGATHDIASGNYATRVPVSSSDELGRLARDFNAMALTLESHEKARRQWVADISHELRTPLAILRGEVEALEDGIRSVTPETIRSLHAEVLRLNRLVDDLYQLALSDIGALSYHKGNLGLLEVLRASAEAHRSEFARKGIALGLDAPEGQEAMVFADRERLDQLFTNLLDNSLKYTDSGGELRIRLECRGEEAVVEFQDSGPGVSEDELDRLFDRLYRVEGSRSRASGGAGLGLAICRNIAEAHAGEISAHPSPLGGVAVRITMPIVGGCA